MSFETSLSHFIYTSYTSPPMKIMVKSGKDIHTVCPWCKGKATITSLELKETKPYKRLTVTECTSCAKKETVEEDIEDLDYAVEITCDFTDKKKLAENIRKLVFLNHCATVKLSKDDKEVISFTTMNSSIDSVEGIIQKAMEIVESAANGNKNLKDTLTTLKSFTKNGFKMFVTDSTGYSRLCPNDVDYTQAQDMTFDELNSKVKDAVHKKIAKKISNKRS